MSELDEIITNQKRGDARQSEQDFDVDAWAQKKRTEREGLFSLLDSTAESLGNPDALRGYLDVQSRFMRMSANNALLVSAQCPQATELASFDDWKAKDVSIKGGQKAIAMFEQGGAYTREDGSEGHYMNVTKMFDISQTTAEAGTPERPTVDSRELLKAITANSGTRIEMSDDLPENRAAVYDLNSNTVFVRRGMEPNTLIMSITNELAVASLCRDGSNPRDNGMAAYAASYMLCKRYGVDTSRFNLSQLSQAFSSLDAKGIRDQLGKARNAAEGISYQMEKTLNPQARSEKNVDPR